MGAYCSDLKMKYEEIQMEKKDECERLIAQERILNNEFSQQERNESFCPIIWDGIMCWPAAKPGETLQQSCPYYIIGFNTTGNATKECTTDGWWINPKYNMSWTNYSGCSEPYVEMPSIPSTDPLLAEWVPYIKEISRFGYITSLVFLIAACAILLSYRKLRCPRNTVHLHLFLSFLLRAAMSLLKDITLEDGIACTENILQYRDDIRYADVVQSWKCKAFMIVWQYCILANYFWILVEGVYFHNLIFMALFSDTSSIIIYVILGWSVPIPIVAFWAAARVTYEDTFCWTTHQNRSVFLLIELPTVATFVVNLFLFINITRVLYIKLNNFLLLDRRITRYRKWTKSTLILMPLYGVHYALFHGFSYSKNPKVTIFWLFCDQLFASSQGLFVSILYCISNGEVVQEIKGSWKSCWKKVHPQREEFDLSKRNNTRDSKFLEVTQCHSA